MSCPKSSVLLSHCHHLLNNGTAPSSQMTDFPSGERQQSMLPFPPGHNTDEHSLGLGTTYFYFFRCSLKVQIRWLKEPQYNNDCTLKGVSAILCQSIIHTGDLSSQTGSGLSHERAVKNSSPSPILKCSSQSEGRSGLRLLCDRAWQLAVRQLLQVEAWHQPNLLEEPGVITRGGRGSRVTTGSSAACIAHH